MSSTIGSNCPHRSLSFVSSLHAARAGFERPDKSRRLKAAKPNKLSDGKKSKLPAEDDPATFPAPLLFPGDDLFEDPEYPSQSFQEWLDADDRNPVTSKHKVIYLVTAPRIEDEVGFMRSWDKPQGCDKSPRVPLPVSQDVLDYLRAFYHGLPVKTLPRLRTGFIAWDEEASKTARKSGYSKYVGLKFGDECVRIRTRLSPDSVYSMQLNLDDLLDAAIAMLPNDAYALLLLVNQDLYEDEEDVFVCGRAYGGSRVAVVSTARYNPDLDNLQSVERVHAWPASHCKNFISTSCTAAPPKAKRQKKSTSVIADQTLPPSASSASQLGPVERAVSVYRALPTENLSLSALSTLWLGRVCRTAAHELGHCFGMDHCVYYACAMQGAATISEDARQPPYLCPVDLAKLLHATSTTAVERYNALLAFCENPERKETLFFAPFAEWIRGRLDKVHV